MYFHDETIFINILIYHETIKNITKFFYYLFKNLYNGSPNIKIVQFKGLKLDHMFKRKEKWKAMIPGLEAGELGALTALMKVVGHQKVHLNSPIIIMIVHCTGNIIMYP